MCSSCLAVLERLSVAETHTAGWIRGVLRSFLITVRAARHLFFDELCQMVVWGKMSVFSVIMKQHFANLSVKALIKKSGESLFI